MQQGDVHLHDSAQELQPRQRRGRNRRLSRGASLLMAVCWFREVMPCILIRVSWQQPAK